MNRSVVFFEQLYKDDPEDATSSSVMAADFYFFGQQKAVPPARRRQMYERSIAITQHYAPAHPEALSTAVLIGENEVGLAELAADIGEKKLHANRAAVALSVAVAAHPANVEAATFLSRAQALR
jgi:hypothetical protein